jgi:hypothetical protein
MAFMKCTSMQQDTGGNIVGNFATTTHNFAPMSIFAHGYIQGFQTLDDDAGADVWVTQVIDQSGVHNVQHFAEFNSNKCTSITFTLFVGDASARAVCITQNFP